MSDNRKVSVEERIYEMMCAGCERERHCHIWCENCDEYEDAVEEAYTEITMGLEK